MSDRATCFAGLAFENSEKIGVKISGQHEIHELALVRSNGECDHVSELQSLLSQTRPFHLSLRVVAPVTRGMMATSGVTSVDQR